MAWPWQTSARTRDDLRKEVERAILKVTGRNPPVSGSGLADMALLGANLGLSSLAVARLAGILQQRLGRKALPFQKLLVAADGTVLHDIRVADLVDFLERELSRPT